MLVFPLCCFYGNVKPGLEMIQDITACTSPLEVHANSPCIRRWLHVMITVLLLYDYISPVVPEGVAECYCVWSKMLGMEFKLLYILLHVPTVWSWPYMVTNHTCVCVTVCPLIGLDQCHVICTDPCMTCPWITPQALRLVFLIQPIYSCTKHRIPSRRQTAMNNYNLPDFGKQD